MEDELFNYRVLSTHKGIKNIWHLKANSSLDARAYVLGLMPEASIVDITCYGRLFSPYQNVYKLTESPKIVHVDFVARKKL